MTKCLLTRFDGVLEIVEPLLVFLPRDVYLDLLTGVQLRVAHAAVVLQVGGRPERSERVEMWLDAEKCIRCQSVGESERGATNNAIYKDDRDRQGCTVSSNPR